MHIVSYPAGALPLAMHPVHCLLGPKTGDGVDEDKEHTAVSG